MEIQILQFFFLFYLEYYFAFFTYQEYKVGFL